MNLEPRAAKRRAASEASPYAGLFFVALSTLTYEILLTRIFSVTMLYHFAFVALSLAMFGMTVGALAVYLLPSVFPTTLTRDRLALVGVLFPVALVVSFLTQLSIPFRVHPSIVAIYAIALTYAVIAVPFVVSGIAVCLVLTRYTRDVGRLYAADLAGAALGCVLLIPLIGWSDAATAVLWVATLAAFGGIAFARGGSSPVLRRWAVAVTVVLAVSAATHTWLVWRQFPVFRILYIKGDFEARPLYEKWNSYSRVRVNGDPNALVLPQGWGLSRTLPADLRVRQLQMDIDVAAGTVMTAFDGDTSTLSHLTYDVTNAGYWLRPDGETLVIGAGGGRDVLSALTYGAQRVTAVEINKDILRTVNGRFGDFTGHLDRDPRVRFVNDEARSFVARSQERYDHIQISLIDTWAATAAGAFVLSENSLYTVEAWTTFLSRLTDRGVLSVSRWYFRDRPDEVYRTTTLAVEALARLGIREPRRHLAIVRNMHLAHKTEMPDGVGTLLVSRAPLTDGELETLEREAGRLQFEVVLSPRATIDPMFDTLTRGDDLEAAVARHPTDISPPTDDSPFFFNMLRLRDVLRLDLLDAGKQTHNIKAVATLAVLLAVVTVLTAACIVLPLWLTRDRVAFAGARPLFAYFIAIGLGFMLVETSQMQRLIIALGHPTYGLSVVLFAVLLSSGAGSYFTAGITADTVARAGARRLVVAVAVLAIFGLVTPAVAQAIEPLPTASRVLASIALLFPIGFMMGMAFPIGMTAAAVRAEALTPWLWGLNGAASVLASVLSVCIALTWSISTAFWTGWACYVIALAALAWIARRGTMEWRHV